MTVFSALSLAGVLFLAALAVGITVGVFLAPRVIRRRQRVAVETAGITVAQMLDRIVALMPLGAAVVDRHRDVVYHNGRAKELGLVRERQLDDEAWKAARRTLAGGADVEFDLLPSKRPVPGRSGSGGARTGAVAERGGPPVRRGLRLRPLRVRTNGGDAARLRGQRQP